MSQELGTVIARRHYFSTDDKSQAPIAEVEVGIPLPSPHSANEFMCSFRIKTTGAERTETVYGIDELQALRLALGYLEATLRRLNASLSLNLRWAGDEKGDLGIRVPQF